MDEKAIELVLNKLEELGRNYGPAFSEQAIKYAHIKAIENTIVPLIVSLVLSYITYICYTVFNKEYKKDYREQNEGLQTICVIAGISAGFLSGVFLTCSINPAAWYGLFDPAAYLSYRLFDKVL